MDAATAMGAKVLPGGASDTTIPGPSGPRGSVVTNDLSLGLEACKELKAGTTKVTPFGGTREKPRSLP